ncbi:unnamed protein product [Rotaria sp. Silwood1]|nr:unnamed protein product [Rotaria sp. Silwood1]CAF4928707.1 unnamed protein product [Rotaria sp. Silwood1]
MWFVLLLVAFIIWILYRPFKFWIIDPWLIHRDLWAQGIPGRHIPIVGEILHIRKSILADNPLGHGANLAAQYGDYYHTSFGPVARLDTFDPELINGVLKTNARCYHKAYIMRLVLGVLLGTDNLLMAEDDVHAQHRRLIAPVFQHQNMNSMISLMVEITLNHMKIWSTAVHHENESIRLNIHEEMARLTLDIVTSCVFGTEILSDEKMHETAHRIVSESLELMEKRLFNMIAIIPIINRLPLAGKRRIDRCIYEGKNLIRQIVDNRPRSCIGQNFAMLEAKIMLALIIRRFRFELEPGQKLVPEIIVTMRPKYGMWMRVSPRVHS